MNGSNTHDGLSFVLVTLMKGVVYRDDNLSMWQEMLRLQAGVRDYFSLIGLELTLFEDEGFAYLRNRTVAEGEEDIPRLITRRRLSYIVSLTLALLRRKLAEHDARSGEERLIMEKEELLETVRTFLPGGTNEAKVTDQIDRAIKRIVELGFIRFLEGEQDKIEVKRILVAFVDAEWLGEFDNNLAAYAAFAAGDASVRETDRDE